MLHLNSFIPFSFFPISQMEFKALENIKKQNKTKQHFKCWEMSSISCGYLVFALIGLIYQFIKMLALK